MAGWAAAPPQAQDLFVPGAVAVDGDALEAQLIGREIDLAHVVGGGLLGEVHRLGDGVVGVFLEGRLELDVPDGGGFVGGDEEAAHVLGDLLDLPDGAGLGDALHEFRRVEAPALGDGLEVGVHLHHFGAFHDPADEGDREEGLDAGRAAGDDADGAGGGDGGGGGVAHAAQAVALVLAAGVGREVAAGVGQAGGGQARFVPDEGHDPFGHGHGLVGVVLDAEL